VEDAEDALGGGAQLTFGGPAECAGVCSRYMQWALAHGDNGTNVFNGRPGRLDFVSNHYKGGGSSAGIVRGEYSLYEYLRTGPGASAKLAALPFHNEEGAPLVRWTTELEWRADARYPAILAKVVNQHLLAVVDNATAAPGGGDGGANPLGLVRRAVA
jgi:L-iduronidase